MSFYLVGIMVVVAVVLITYSFWPSASSEADVLKRRMSGRSAQEKVADVRKRAKDSVAKRVVQTIAPLAVRPVMITNPEEMSKLRMKLATAGFRAEKAPTLFLASKTIVGICLGLAALTYALSSGKPVNQVVGIAILGLGLGFLAPNMWLGSAIKKRGNSIREGLPDTLDMLVISVEAGLGLDAAFQRVGDEMRKVHPILSQELQMVTLESQMGIPRAEALENFATRTGIDEAKSLVGVINQAERFGTSIARALRRQSGALRVKRRQKAEERAQQTTVKLMLPLILFIFPAIFVVLLGPAVLTMIEVLAENDL